MVVILVSRWHNNGRSASRFLEISLLQCEGRRRKAARRWQDLRLTVGVGDAIDDMLAADRDAVQPLIAVVRFPSTKQIEQV
jgi:hypothetical protein